MQIRTHTFTMIVKDMIDVTVSLDCDINIHNYTLLSLAGRVDWCQFNFINAVE